MHSSPCRRFVSRDHAHRWQFSSYGRILAPTFTVNACGDDALPEIGGTERGVPRKTALMEYVPAPKVSLVNAVPLPVNWAEPRIAKPWHRLALASQNTTEPCRTGIEPSKTVAVRVTGVPMSTERDEIVSSVVVAAAEFPRA